MKRAALALALLGAAGAAWAARTKVREEGAPADSFQWPDFGDIPTYFNSTETNQESNMQTDRSQNNLRAFLKTIIGAEGTGLGGRDPYATTYAYAFTITDFGDHPANRGWKGVPLSDRLCALAGFGPGCVSTAAGAYQIKKATWNRIRTKLSLRDFSPASQDAAAIELIKERGALADVHAGRFAQAVAKCAKEWASLPGAGYGQPEKSLASLQATYASAGGAFA